MAANDVRQIVRELIVDNSFNPQAAAHVMRINPPVGFGIKLWRVEYTLQNAPSGSQNWWGGLSLRRNRSAYSGSDRMAIDDDVVGTWHYQRISSGTGDGFSIFSSPWVHDLHHMDYLLAVTPEWIATSDNTGLLTMRAALYYSFEPLSTQMRPSALAYQQEVLR